MSESKSLSERVAAALVWDKNAAISECIEINQDDQAGLRMAIKDFCDGGRFEHTRLASLHQSLVAAVSALEIYAITNSAFPEYGDVARKALLAIAESLKERE